MQSPPPSAPPPPPAPAPYGYSQPYGYAQQHLGWTAPPPVSPRRWWFWGCGGCAAIALVAVAVLVFVVLRIFTSSPLRQFPTETGATTSSDNFTSAGNQTTETIHIVDPHSLTDVETYYEQALHANGWTTDTHDPSQASTGDTWTIGRNGSPAQAGSITFGNTGANTDIVVTYNY